VSDAGHSTSRSEEVEYDDRLLSPNGAVELTKSRYSCFVNTPLQQLLDEQGVNTVVICCDSMARDALGRDYYVEFILDATGTPETETMDEGPSEKPSESSWEADSHVS
jgi:nicotinamidase-related amidase